MICRWTPTFPRCTIASKPRGRAAGRASPDRFRTVLSDLQTRVADMTETVERVENAVKVTNDVYLARVYAAALELFREQAWRRGIDRKLAILRETYAMLNDEAQAARAELLELAIIVLIVLELVLGVIAGRARSVPRPIPRRVESPRRRTCTRYRPPLSSPCTVNRPSRASVSTTNPVVALTTLTRASVGRTVPRIDAV